MIQLGDRYFMFSESLRSIELDWQRNMVNFAYDGGTLRPASASSTQMEDLRGMLSLMSEDFKLQLRIKHDDLERYVAQRAMAETEEPA